MKIKIERFEIVGKCLFWEEKKILVVGDLHLGYEEYLNEQGIVFPKSQISETFTGLKKVLEKTGKLNMIVLLGDVKHHFAGVLASEFGDFYKLVDFFRENLLKNGKIIIVKGNHDSILEPIVRNYGIVKLVDSWREEDVLFLHGYWKDFNKNKLDLLDNNLKLVVLGHFHPAISLKEDVKKESYKCFLYGKEKKLKKEMIIVPSFFPLVEGSDVLKDNGVLEGVYDFSNFSVFAVDELDGVYDLGQIKSLKRLK